MSFIRNSRLTVSAAFVASLLASPVSAQTTWSIEGSTPSYGEFNAPPPCPVGLLPYAVTFPPTPSPGCPSNLPFPAVGCRQGGSAVDNNGNVFSGGPAVPAMIHTDGFTIEMVTYAGAYILSMPIPLGSIIPGPISGLGYDSAADVIWITDGFFAAGIGVSPCVTPIIIFPAFVLPLVGGTIAGGLGWDPCSGTLWFCECGGAIVNCTTTGGLLTAFGAIPLGVPLTGLDVNSTNGNVQVTDGTLVAEFTPTGALAPTGPFYLSANPYPISIWAAGVDGLGFSLRPQKYGLPCPTAGPSIGWAGGYPFAGNGSFAINQTGATPGRTAILLLSLGYSCPPLAFGSCPAGTGIWLTFPLLALLPSGVVPGSGMVTRAIPIPPTVGCAIPVGVGIFAQFVNIGSGLELTDGLSFTIGQM